MVWVLALTSRPTESRILRILSILFRYWWRHNIYRLGFNDLCSAMVADSVLYSHRLGPNKPCRGPRIRGSRGALGIEDS